MNDEELSDIEEYFDVTQKYIDYLKNPKKYLVIKVVHDFLGKISLDGGSEIE